MISSKREKEKFPRSGVGQGWIKGSDILSYPASYHMYRVEPPPKTQILMSDRAAF